MTLTASHRLSVRPAWRYTARQAAWAVVDMIFPPQCGGCGKEGQRFCADCRASLAYLPAPVCEHCGFPLRAGEMLRCASCLRQPTPALASVRSVAFFEGPLQQALHRLKYKRDIILADALAVLLCEAWPAYGFAADLVVPVPLSAQRMRERGYNQAGLLADAFAALMGLPYTPAGAARFRHTASQVGLSAHERQANVAGAFRGRTERVADKAVILVDDVYTTGATLNACAEALLAAGAVRVWGFTLGRAHALSYAGSRRAEKSGSVAR